MKLAELENLARDIRKLAGEDANPEITFVDYGTRGFPRLDIEPWASPARLHHYRKDNGDFNLPLCVIKSATEGV